MKKLLTLALIGLISTTGAQAQDTVDEFGLFDHVSAGLSLGTTGIGIEVAAPLCNFVQARMGYSFMPGIKKTFNFDIDTDKAWVANNPKTGKKVEDVDIEGKFGWGDFKLLFDIFPSKKSIFHFTAGFYIGKSKVIEAYNVSPLVSDEKYPDGSYKYWGVAGPDLGSGSQFYTVVSEPDGQVKLDVKTNSFKPYLGIGVGRAVPKGRFSVCGDLGVQFWGKPELWTNVDEGNGPKYSKVERSKITGTDDYCDDIKDGIKTGEKVVIFPVLTIRINGRFF